MNILTLVNGRKLEGSVMRFVDDSLIFVYLKGLTVAEGVAIFADARNVQIITETIDKENVNVYEGYTEIRAASHEFGNCNLTMGRRADAD